MDEHIKAELRDLIQRWDENQSVRVLRLGHSVRVVPGAGKNDPPREERVNARQLPIYRYFFRLLALILPDNSAMAGTWSDFAALFDMAEHEDLTAEERTWGENLAWAVSHVGWNAALTGHPESCYITIQREPVELPEGELA